MSVKTANDPPRDKHSLLALYQFSELWNFLYHFEFIAKSPAAQLPSANVSINSFGSKIDHTEYYTQ